MSENQGQTFFQKVGTRKERERAFLLLSQSKVKFECQLPGNQAATIVPESIRDSHMIVVTQNKLPTEKETIVTFQVGQEKYFMKTSFKEHDFASHYIMDLEPALFKLQRRNSFRVQIPPDYLAKVHIENIDGVPASKKLPMFDLSGGGFSLEIPCHIPFELKQNQVITGYIKIGGRIDKYFEAVIRHVIKVGSQGSGLTKVGAEFINLMPSDQQSFINIVMDIHRDMFSKFKIGSR